MRKTVLIFFCFCALFGWTQSNGYFEDRFFCNISDNQISVNIVPSETSCFSYVALLDTSIALLNEDIQKVDDHIALGKWLAYWQGIHDDLVIQLEELASLKQQFLVAIDDYEQELFTKIHALSIPYIVQQQRSLRQKRAIILQLMERLKQQGDETNYVLVKQKLDIFTHALVMLDAMLDARSFVDFIPLLKKYFSSIHAKI